MTTAVRTTQRAYPAYKDSGIEWLGEIPAHWQVLKLKQVSTIVGRIGFRGYTQADIVDPGEGALALSPSNIRNGAVDYSVKTYISWDKYEESPEIKVFENDIVFVKTGSTIGKTAILKAVTEPMTLNPQVVVLKNIQCAPDFLSYAMNAEYFQYQVYGYRFGGSTPAMTQESLGRIVTVLPRNRDEQEAIARFLDHKTAQIDALIAKKEALLARLADKRTALTSQAVTQGLDPTVPMRDSGIEWLGEIPEHWVMSKLRYQANVISKGTTPSTIYREFSNEGIRFIKAENIQNGVLHASPEFFIDEETDSLLKRSQLQANDVLIVIAGATTGKAAVITYEMLPANTNQAVCFLRLNDTRYAQLLAAWLNTKFIQEVIWNAAVQSAQPNLAMDDIRNFVFLVPPPTEINSICDYLAGVTRQLDKQQRKIQSAIDKLKQYRTALITNAVTGKIDVREAGSWATEAPTSS